MIDIYSKYDNIHENIMFYVLIYINNYIIICIICMLSVNFCVVIENAQIHAKINTKLTNFKNKSRIDYYNDELRSNLTRFREIF